MLNLQEISYDRVRFYLRKCELQETLLFAVMIFGIGVLCKFTTYFQNTFS